MSVVSSVVNELISDDLDNHSLVALAVELGVEDALPGPQIELAFCDWQRHRLVHQQTLQMRIAIVLSRLMMFIVLAEGRQLLKPLVDVLNESRFVVIDVDRGGDVHGRDEGQPLLHSTFCDRRFDLRRDVDVVAMLLGVKFEVLGMRLHWVSGNLLSSRGLTMKKKCLRILPITAQLE